MSASCRKTSGSRPRPLCWSGQAWGLRSGRGGTLGSSGARARHAEGGSPVDPVRALRLGAPSDLCRIAARDPGDGFVLGQVAGFGGIWAVELRVLAKSLEGG